MVISAVATSSDGALISVKRPPTFRRNQFVLKIKVSVVYVGYYSSRYRAATMCSKGKFR